MAAYLIADIEVTDPEVYAEYTALAAAAVERYGGRVLVRGGRRVSLEGQWEPDRLALVEFPSMAQAHAFYESAEYQKAARIRQASACSRLLLVEGV